MIKNLSFLTLSLALGFASVSAPLVWGNESATTPTVTSDVVLQNLKDGNQRFVEGKSRHPSQDPERRKALAKGQNPGAIVLSCSDSRVPPELVFDQGLGDVFTVRVAGNVPQAPTVASIEYAVEHLGAKLIVVMGHESCGAVKAALNTPADQSAGSKDLDILVSSIQENLTGADRAVASEDTVFRKPSMANVNGVAERLVKRSPIIRKHVEAGDVKIVRAIYSLDSGKVDFWNSGTAETAPAPVSHVTH